MALAEQLVSIVGGSEPFGDRTRTTQLDADGEMQAFICHMLAAGDIHKLHFRTGTVTTGDTIKGSCQDLDATGDPDEVADQSGTVLVDASDDNVWKEITLGADRTVAIGDIVPFVLEFNSWVAGNMQIATGDTLPLAAGMYYSDEKTTGSWVKVGDTPLIKIELDDATFLPVHCALSGVPGLRVYNSDSTPDENALRFKLTYPARLLGAKFRGGVATGANFDLVLHEGVADETGVRTASVDGDHVASATDDYYGAIFASTYDLAANTEYLLSLKPTTTNNVTLNFIQCDAAAELAQLPMGLEWHMATRVGGGSWTADTTERPAIDLILSAFDDGVGGGSNVIISRPRRII